MVTTEQVALIMAKAIAKHHGVNGMMNDYTKAQFIDFMSNHSMPLRELAEAVLKGIENVPE